jgi:hypothetical protein
VRATPASRPECNPNGTGGCPRSRRGCETWAPYRQHNSTDGGPLLRAGSQVCQNRANLGHPQVKSLLTQVGAPRLALFETRVLAMAGSLSFTRSGEEVWGCDGKSVTNEPTGRRPTPRSRKPLDLGHPASAPVDAFAAATRKAGPRSQRQSTQNALTSLIHRQRRPCFAFCSPQPSTDFASISTASP